MDNLTIKISSADVAMLRRIAKSQNRRFDDFLPLVFAEGLEYYFCETEASVKKLPEEYTEAELKQRELNNKIRDEDHKSFDEMKSAGFVPVNDYFTNHQYNRETEKYTDEFIAPMVERLRALATD